VGLDRRDQEHWRRVLVWFTGAAPFWLAGAAADGGARLLWWAAATLIELAGTWTAHPLPGPRLDSRQVGFAGGHMLERGRLFMIVAFAAAGDRPYRILGQLVVAHDVLGTSPARSRCSGCSSAHCPRPPRGQYVDVERLGSSSGRAGRG
jgi:hypothetical protein